MPEPALLTEGSHTPHSEPGGSNGISICGNDSAGSYVLPPLPHQAYPLGQLINPHVDSPSCKQSVSSEKALYDLFAVGYTDIENVTLSRSPSGSTSGRPHVNVDRNNSLTSNSTGTELIVIGPSSSIATSLYQDDSSLQGRLSTPGVRGYQHACSPRRGISAESVP